MSTTLFRHIRHVRGTLFLTIIFGMLGTGAIIIQMALLSRVVNNVFLLHKGPGQVELLLRHLPGIDLGSSLLGRHEEVVLRVRRLPPTALG